MASSTISNILNTALNATLEATGQKPTVLTNTNDLDTIFEPGWYFWSDSIPQNVPANRTYATMWIYKDGINNRKAFIFSAGTTMTIYTRLGTSASWTGSWTKFEGIPVT